MKKYLQVGLSIIVCELIGIAGSLFTFNSIPAWYFYLRKPFFAPPNWLFGPVWTLLYLMMGIAIYLVLSKKVAPKLKQVKESAKFYFAAQLFLNFLWTVGFFGLRSPVIGLGIILVLWASIALTINCFAKIDKNAAYLMVPYLAWVSFASLLNIGIVYLN